MSELEKILRILLADGVTFATIGGRLKVANWILEQPYTRKFIRENEAEAIQILERIQSDDSVRQTLNNLTSRGVAFYPETEES